MDKLPDREVIARLPVAEWEEALANFLAPVTAARPVGRLRWVLEQAGRGIVGSLSPVVTEVARHVTHSQECVWPMAKRG